MSPIELVVVTDRISRRTVPVCQRFLDEAVFDGFHRSIRVEHSSKATTEQRTKQTPYFDKRCTRNDAIPSIQGGTARAADDLR